MTKYTIPLDNLPNQSFEIQLGNKNCQFEFITRGVFMFMNLSVNRVPQINGVICLNGVNLIQYDDIDFDGKLYFKDTQGNLDPIYYGLNDRWLLVYEVDE